MKKKGEVVAIKNLFEKYQKTLKAPQKTVESEVIRIVQEIVGFELTEAQVRYTPATRVVYVTAPSILKQRIKMSESKIIQLLKDRLGTKSAPQVLL